MTSVSKKICFFSNVNNIDDLNRIEFYKQDIKILTDLGYDVRLCTKYRNLRLADIYFVWWWTWAFLPITLGKIFNRPVIITGTFNCWSYYDRPWFERLLISYSVRNAHANIVVSTHEYDQLCSMFPSASIIYCPHVVDINQYKCTYKNRSNFIYTTATMVSGNAERKSIPELIDAAIILHKKFTWVKFIFAGKVEKKYKEIVRNLGADSYISFPGEITLEDKISYLQSCIIYAQPSKFEGFGLAILEALSCGAPVVTSRVGAVDEVAGSAAIYVDGYSPQSIADGITKLLTNAELRSAIGILGVERAKAMFNFDRRKNHIASIIDTLIYQQPTSSHQEHS